MEIEVDLSVCDDCVDPNDCTAFMGEGDGSGAVVGEAWPEG